MARKSKKKNSKYGSTRDRRRRQREERETSTSSSYIKAEGAEFFTPKAGTNHVRFIPYELSVDNEYGEVGELYWQREFGVLRNMGAEEKWVVPTIAASKKFRKVINEQERDGILTEEEVKEFWPKRRMLYNVVDLDSDDPDKILLWEFSYHLFQKMLEGELDENEEYDAYSDLVDGFSLKIRMNEKKLGTYTFLETTRIDFVPAEDLDDDVVEGCYDLDKSVDMIDFDELMELYEGGSASDEQEDEEEEPKKSKKKKSKKEPEPEEDDEEVEDDDDEDDDIDDSDEEADAVTKEELSVGCTITITDDDGDEFEAKVIDIPKKGSEIEIVYDGDEDEDSEMIEVSDVISFEEPKRKKRSSKKKAKKK